MKKELTEKVNLLIDGKRSIIAVPVIDDMEEASEFWDYVKYTLGGKILISYYKDNQYIRLLGTEGRRLTSEEQADIGYSIDYSVADVVCDYGVFKNGELIDDLILNSKVNAEEMCRILRLDLEHKRFDDSNIV